MHIETEQLPQFVIELTQKRQLLQDKLSQRAKTPQEGDIFMFSSAKTVMELVWVVLRRDDDDPKRLFIVAADINPKIGSTDIALSKKALCNPLSLRCGQNLWIDASQLTISSRIGIVEEWDRKRAIDKVKQLTENQIRSSVLQQETDCDPEYQEWMTKVSEERNTLATLLAARPASKIWQILSATVQRLKIMFANSWPASLNEKLEAIKTPRNFGWTIVGATVTLVLVLMIVIPVSTPPNQFLIEQGYQTILSSRQLPQIQQTVQPQFSPWVNTEAYLSFAPPSKPSEAMRAFSAGVWVGSQQLFSSLPNQVSQVTQEWLTKDWSNTPWVTYFKLGQWTLLMETVALSVSKSQDNLSHQFWKRQQLVFQGFQENLELRKQAAATNSDQIELDWILSRFKRIAPLLDQLPTPDHLENYGQLAKGLKSMREGVVPRL